jgi:hypothetical protein
VYDMFYNLCGEVCNEKIMKISYFIWLSWFGWQLFLLYLGLKYLLLWCTWMERKAWISVEASAVLFPIMAITSLGLASFRDFLVLPFLIAVYWRVRHTITTIFKNRPVFDFYKHVLIGLIFYSICFFNLFSFSLDFPKLLFQSILPCMILL